MKDFILGILFLLSLHSMAQPHGAEKQPETKLSRVAELELQVKRLQAELDDCKKIAAHSPAPSPEAKIKHTPLSAEEFLKMLRAHPLMTRDCEIVASKEYRDANGTEVLEIELKGQGKAVRLYLDKNRLVSRPYKI